MTDPENMKTWDADHKYVERTVRRKVGVSALRKIHGMVDDMEREERQGRKVALLLIGLFVVLLAGFLGYLALR